MVTFDSLVAAEWLRLDAFLIDDDLGADFGDDWFAIVGRDGNVEHEPIFDRHQIALPAAPDDGVALAHEKAIAGVFECARVIRFGGIVEKTQDALAAAVGRVEKYFAIAARHVERLQNAKIAGVFDPAALVARRFIQVDDDSIQSVSRIDFAVDFADEFFIGAGDGEFMTLGEGFSFSDDEAGKHLIL